MQVLYKQLLQPDEVDELNNQYQNLTILNTNLTTGLRHYCDVDLTDSFITKRLYTTLNDYYPNMILDRWARYYKHEYGAVKPHRDINHDNKSNYTLLIYLSDDFEGGQLSIKTIRLEEELLFQPEMHHKVFKIKPLRGYGVIFKKEELHWADECYGDKIFLLVHFYN